MKNPIHKKNFESILTASKTQGASDLHISGNTQVIFRLNGKLVPMNEHILRDQEVEEMTKAVLSEEQWLELKQNKNLDLSYSLDDGTRFRVNIYHERGHCAFAIRRLESNLFTVTELGLPPQLESLTTLKDGLILFTGPTGSGKSTSLAAMINSINQNSSRHIITIEDPVEYLHSNINSLVHQRELGLDVHSFSDALRAALREDPDVILVGEMRDLPTIRAAVTAAETGHLVFSTLHTNDTVGVVDRIIASYPAEEQGMIQRQLSATLRAVVAQRLLPTTDEKGRCAAVEVLMVNNAVSNLIRTGQCEQIYSVLETNTSNGMQSMEHSLAQLVISGVLNEMTARQLVRNHTLFDSLIGTAQSAGSRRCR